MGLKGVECERVVYALVTCLRGGGEPGMSSSPGVTEHDGVSCLVTPGSSIGEGCRGHYSLFDIRGFDVYGKSITDFFSRRFYDE